MKGSFGFTLLELLVTIAVVAILTVWAVPGFGNMIQESRRAAANNELITTLTYARTIAISRRVPVIVCKSTNATTSTPTCSTSGTDYWDSGWFAYVDNNGNGSFDSGTDEVIRAHESLISGITLRGNTAFANQIAFSSAGITANGTFAICDKRGWPNGARAIDVKLGGRVETQTPAQATITSCSP